MTLYGGIQTLQGVWWIDEGAEQAIQVAPNDILLLQNMAQLFERTNRLQEAENTYLKALQISPSDFGILKTIKLQESKLCIHLQN